MTAPSLFGSQMPQEVKIALFSFLPKSALCSTMSVVCKEWHKLCFDPSLWSDLDAKLHTYQNVDASDQTQNITKIVFLQLRKYDSLLNEIIPLIKNDSQLASIINSTSPSLEELKKMPKLDRSFLVIRGLNNKATVLLTTLSTNCQNEVNEGFARQGSEAKMIQFVEEFFDKNKHLPLINKIIKESGLTCDAGKVLGSLTVFFHMPPAHKSVCIIWSSLIKSHPDLSTFFSSNFPDSAITVTMNDFVIRSLIPMMETQGCNVTKDDWIKCGLKFENSN